MAFSVSGCSSPSTRFLASSTVSNRPYTFLSSISSGSCTARNSSTHCDWATSVAYCIVIYYYEWELRAEKAYGKVTEADVQLAKQRPNFIADGLELQKYAHVVHPIVLLCSRGDFIQRSI